MKSVARLVAITATLAIAPLALLAAPALAQTPAIVNGTLDTRAASGALERDVAAIIRDAAGPMWIGYSVAAQRRSQADNCGWGRDGVRVVEPVKLEGSDDLFVLVRIEDRKVDSIRVSPAHCSLDLGGLTLHWLTGVSAARSLDWLATFTAGAHARRVENAAITAIALHGDAGVTDRLIALARDGQERAVRSSALFWLSQRAGDRASRAISEAIDRDPDTAVKRQAVFALSQLPRSEGVPRLIDLARTNKNPAVRKQAMFWLGQSEDPRALAFFEEVLRAR
jgi:hypothetical protein